MEYKGHKFHDFTVGMRSSDREIASYNFKKAPMQRLEPPAPGNMPGTTIPLALANRAADSRNNFISPNPPDIMRITKGVKIVGVA
jgi:hypothetical protein